MVNPYAQYAPLSKSQQVIDVFDPEAADATKNPYAKYKSSSVNENPYAKFAAKSAENPYAKYAPEKKSILQTGLEGAYAPFKPLVERGIVEPAKDLYAAAKEAWNKPPTSSDKPKSTGLIGIASPEDQEKLRQSLIDQMKGPLRVAGDAASFIPEVALAGTLGQETEKVAARQAGLPEKKVEQLGKDTGDVASMVGVSGLAKDAEAITSAAKRPPEKPPVIETPKPETQQHKAYTEAYHGSPADFDAYSVKQIGSGEGHQAYGHGLYFADKPEVSETYRKGISAGRVPGQDVMAEYYKPGNIVPSYGGGYDRVLHYEKTPTSFSVKVEKVKKDAEGNWKAVEPPRVHSTIPPRENFTKVLGEKGELGQLYRVALPKKTVLMEWEKPMLEQPKAVRGPLERLYDLKKYKTAASFYSFLSKKLGGNVAASEYLDKLGIRGHSYLDQGSRAGGKGSRNYVIYSDKYLKNLEKLKGEKAGLTPFGEKEKQRTFQSQIFSKDQPVASTKPVTSVQGVADKFYQSRNAIRADYKEFTKWAKQFKDVPKTFWQKALDHIDDPKGVPLSSGEQLVFDRSVGLLQKEIDANRAEIKASGFDPKYLETESEGLGGAIRQRKGSGTPMDRLTGTKTAARAPEGGRSLSRSAGTFKSRNMMSLIKDGERRVVHIDDEGNIFDASEKGDPLGRVDETGKPDIPGAKLGEATRKEIETATGGDIKYHDNAFGVYSTALLQTRRALRSVRLLNEIKKAPEMAEIARPPMSKGEIPKGWREIPDSPEFRGWHFEPKYAEEIEDFLKGTKRDSGSLNMLDKLNRFTLNLLFWANPIHAYNITDAFLTTKGLGALAKDLPGTTGDLLKSVKSVATRDKYNMQQARAGVPMPGLDTAGEEFRRMIMDIMGVKARQDPRNFLQFIKRFGFDKPADFFSRMSEVSHKAVFSWQDVLQQTLERGYMRQGLSQAQATEKMAKTFMDYRTPSRVMDQRWMGQALQGQAWLDFPKYAYGRLKGLYNMTSGAAKLDPHSIDQLLMVAALYEFGQHAINPLIKQYTGQDNAEAGNFGYTAIPDLLSKMAAGQRTPGQALQSMASPGYLLQGIDLARGINPYTGKEISVPGESPGEVGMDYASELANKLSPMQRLGQVSSGTVTPEDLWLEQLGVKFPGEMPKSVGRQLKAREKYGSKLDQELNQ